MTRALRWLVLLAFLLKEMLLSAVRVAWLAVQPRIRLRTAFVTYPLTVTSNVQISLLANLVTLTPGTVSIDVSDDRKTMIIHALDVANQEAMIGRIAAGFETKVLGVTR